MHSEENGQAAGLSVLIATRDRARSLEAMLASLAREAGALAEVLVIDNGSTDGTAALLRGAARPFPGLRSVHHPAAGKSRALNRGLELVGGETIAFLDDDVLVRPGWARALLGAARLAPDAALQGRIRPPEAVRADPDRVDLWRRYRTLPIVDREDVGYRPHTLTGANMALPRTWLERLSGFDPELGPGAAGLGEDSQLAARLLAAGGRIAYVPDACVEHEHDRSRLTEAYFERYHRRAGRSRLIQNGNVAPASLLPNLMLSAARCRVAALFGRGPLYYRQRRRYLTYAGMLDGRRDGLGQRAESP